MISQDVAIIMRTKDRPIFLKRALLSVISQNYQKWNIIIINDGGNSTDIGQIINLYINKENESKIKIINLNKSVGMEAASNIGIKNSDSKYIVIHDDDDTWEKTFLSETVNFLETQSYSNSIKGVFSQTNIVKEVIKNNEIIIKKKNIYKKYNNVIVNINDLLINNIFPPISFIYNRDVIDKIGYYNENLPVLGDWDFNLRFIQYYDIFNFKKQLANYHVRINNGKLSNNFLNSIVKDNELHNIYEILIRNKYFRNNIDSDHIGIGYLLTLNSNFKILKKIEKILTCIHLIKY